MQQHKYSSRSGLLAEEIFVLSLQVRLPHQLPCWPVLLLLLLQILHAVGLDLDLAAMPSGDLTVVGEW